MSQAAQNTTETRILKTAIQLFSENGFHGTTVDAIVAEAKVNKRMVYYYFGNKEKLYESVLTEAYKRLEMLEEESAQESLSIEEWIKHIVRIYFDFLQNNPEFSKLVLWENLNQGRGLQSNPSKITKYPILKKLDQTIKRGVKEGQLREDLDARHLLINLIGLCQVYSSNQYTLSQILGMNLQSRRVLNKGIEHASELLLHGIMKHP